MESLFLDQGVIIGYASYVQETLETQNYLDIFSLAAVKFFQLNKLKKFVTCFYITEHDLPKFLKRRKIAIEELRKKLQQEDYEIGSSENARDLLWPQDIAWIKKIYILRNFFPEKQLLELILRIESLFGARIDYLLSRIVSEVVLPVTEIDIELRSHLHTYIGNFSDCNVIASAIQYNTQLSSQKREEERQETDKKRQESMEEKQQNITRTVVVTTDKKDWQDVDKFLGMNIELEKKYKCPRWVYLLDAVKEKGK